MNISDVKVIALPKVEDPRGNLSIIEQLKQIPFIIRRAYWIYDVPGGVERGEHAYKRNEEFIVALSGSFDVVLDDGETQKVFQLNRSYKGIYVPPGTWRKMSNFSTNSLALILASTAYNADDYIHDYSFFLKWKREEERSSCIQKPEFNQSQSIESILGGLKKSMGHVDNVDFPSVYDCSLCELVKNHHPEGNLTYIYEHVHIPFAIDRVFYTYDIPGGESRGAHAHKECHQFIIAASGAFEVVLDDGVNKRSVFLNRPFWGLHVPPGIWCSQREFSSGSICLVLASHAFDESDYIRDYKDFLTYRNLK